MSLRSLPLSVALALAVAVAPFPAAAADDAPADPDPKALFAEATAALAGDRPNEAIAKLEALSDRGVVDAVVSFDRGLAYAARVRAGGSAEQPGDLGRAAHGFEEARELTRDPALKKEATLALTTLHSEIARRRARAGDAATIEQAFSFGRAVTAVLSENAWAALAALLAFVVAGAIVVRRLAVRSRARVAATTAGAVATALLLVTAALTWIARDTRKNLREGVLVVPAARLLDARHLPREGAPALPEGLRVRILDEEGGYSHIAFLGGDGIVATSSVLPLARR